MPRPLKPEIFHRLQETQATLQRVRTEAAHLSYEIAQLQFQLERAEEARVTLETQVQLLQELSQIASQEGPENA